MNRFSQPLAMTAERCPAGQVGHPPLRGL